MRNRGGYIEQERIGERLERIRHEVHIAVRNMWMT